MSSTVSEGDLLRLPCACATLRRATRAVTQLYEDAFRPIGLTAPQYTVLAIVNAFGEVKQGKAGELLAMDSTTLTRVVRLMQGKGWIQARTGKDRRERYLSLTTRGRDALDQAKPVWREVQRKLRESYGAADWEKMFTLVDRVTTGVQHLASEQAS